MRLLSDVERLMAARMVIEAKREQVREGCRRSEEVCTCWSSGFAGAARRSMIPLFVERPSSSSSSSSNHVTIQNTWAILAGATNNGRLEWTCFWRKKGPTNGKRDGRSSRVTKLNYVGRASIFCMFSFSCTGYNY